MTFLSEPEPPRGVAQDVLPGIRRVVARNSGVMTCHGTNTFLLDGDDGLTVIDPGPDDAEHVADVLRAAGGTPITRIVLTHAHHDHHGAVKALKQATGAPTWGYHTSGSPSAFIADHRLDDGGEVAGLKAVFTPGHAQDHLSFEYHVPGTGQILFSGDHVMAWSSSIVNPPDGNMVDYYHSLELLLPRPDVLYLPAHGPAEPNPHALVESLLKHRQMREATILTELRNGPSTVREIAERLYAKTNPFLKVAAQRNVLAHLQKLRAEALVAEHEAPDVSYAAMLKNGDDIFNPDVEDREALMSIYQKMIEQDGARRFSAAA
jgi:glyoxylase-like metal-dependent hydrolase (beta-lactamase superfamily II)